ncbi:hypothetical protein ACFVVX_35420 [Kitasatospora sp. NPDC058170]|uniref:hypothetical protein n=1 Tax=Kitasatospora sp. NPDC058170 TaxID=3346364 RepID=UPI0036D7B331
MRWLGLYARSRQMPASAGVVVLVALAVCALNQDGPGPVDLGMAVLVLTVNVAAASVGLGGRDVVLERTAAIRWVPRRAAHVLLIGAFAGAVLLAVQATGAKLAPTEVVLRDSAGLAGLAGLGAVLCGAQLAWTLPTGWLAIALLVPAPQGRVGEVIDWMIFPPGTAASSGTAWTLLATGTVAYALAGPRR